jgi:hypothetical protein
MDPSNIPRPLGPLPDNALHATLEPIFASLQSHAHANGYALAKETTTATRQVYKCSKGGNYRSKGRNSKVEPSKRRKHSGSIKTRCPFRVVAHRTLGGQWQVQVCNGGHNHGATSATTTSTKHRRIALAPEARSDICVMVAMGNKASLILQAVQLKHRDVVLVAKDIYNMQHSYRTKQLAGMKPIRWLLEVCNPTPYLELANELYRN